MKTLDDREFAFEYRSVHANPTVNRWRVRIMFPAGTTAEGMLPVEAFDGNDAPIVSGYFEVAGKKLKIQAGKSEIRYSDFVAGRHEKAIWMYKQNAEPVPGGLTFA